MSGLPESGASYVVRKDIIRVRAEHDALYPKLLLSLGVERYYAANRIAPALTLRRSAGSPSSASPAPATRYSSAGPRQGAAGAVMKVLFDVYIPSLKVGMFFRECALQLEYLANFMVGTRDGALGWSDLPHQGGHLLQFLGRLLLAGFHPVDQGDLIRSSSSASVQLLTFGFLSVACGAHGRGFGRDIRDPEGSGAEPLSPGGRPAHDASSSGAGPRTKAAPGQMAFDRRRRSTVTLGRQKKAGGDFVPARKTKRGRTLSPAPSR